MLFVTIWLASKFLCTVHLGAGSSISLPASSLISEPPQCDVRIVWAASWIARLCLYIYIAFIPSCSHPDFICARFIVALLQSGHGASLLGGQSGCHGLLIVVNLLYKNLK